MKFYLKENRSKRNVLTWTMFAEGGIPVGIIEPSTGCYRKGNYVCYYYEPSMYGSYLSRNFNNNETKNVYAAKKLLEQFLLNNPQVVENIKLAENKKRKAHIFDIKRLPELEENEKDFYPTPQSLAGKMLAKVRNLKDIKTVLEPSAGLGDLAEVVKNVLCQKHKYNQEAVDIDVIEIDGNLQKILKAKEEFKLVHDNFLSYSTHKRYDLIAMNPPFSKGAEHLLKAMDMQRKTGGQIVCLLNAETIRNPYTTIRQQLAKELLLLGRSNYSVEFVSDAFKKAKRTSNVEIAIIYCNFPVPEAKSSFFERMEKAAVFNRQEEKDSEIISADPIDARIQRYKVECSAGLELIKEYRAMIPRILTDANQSTFNKPIIELKVNGHDCDENRFLKSVRLKYWKDFFHNEDLVKNLTSELRDSFHSSVQEMADYEFSRFNIKQVLTKMAAEMMSGREETIMKLFDELSAEHAYFPECKNNIWGFSGWKTNKAHKVNYKCIVPCYGIYTERSWDPKAFDVYRAYSFLADIEKCLNYLDGVGTLDVSLERQLEYAASAGITKNIHCKYFDVTFYKKGTCHITFTNHYIVDVLNIYAANNRNWLPPSYGKVKYEEMTKEEQQVIDEFQGKDSYDNVFENKSLYLPEYTSILPLLGA